MVGFLPEKCRAGAAIRGVAALIAIALLSGCQRNAPADDTPQDAPSASVSEAPAVVPPSLALLPASRGDLLTAVAAAADATASGRPLPQANLRLTSRSFELRLPFGCDAGIDGRWGQVTLDTERAVLRVRVSPERWNKDSPIAATAGSQPVDAIEGFWIERPWTTSETCPSQVAPAAAQLSEPATVPRQQTVAIAQFFAPDASRTSQRKDRPYTYTGKVKPEDQVSGPMHLRLTGRIAGFGDGQPVHCVQSGPAERPTCVLAVELTGVAFEAGTSGEVLAEWNY